MERKLEQCGNIIEAINRKAGFAAGKCGHMSLHYADPANRRLVTIKLLLQKGKDKNYYKNVPGVPEKGVSCTKMIALLDIFWAGMYHQR